MYSIAAMIRVWLSSRNNDSERHMSSEQIHSCAACYTRVWYLLDRKYIALILDHLVVECALTITHIGRKC